MTATRVRGTYEGRPVSILIEDGLITEGRYDTVSVQAEAMVATESRVAITGMWHGVASFDDLWAIRAMFWELMPDARFEGDEPPSLGDEDDSPDTIY